MLAQEAAGLNFDLDEFINAIGPIIIAIGGLIATMTALYRKGIKELSGGATDEDIAEFKDSIATLNGNINKIILWIEASEAAHFEAELRERLRAELAAESAPAEDVEE